MSGRWAILACVGTGYFNIRHFCPLTFSLAVLFFIFIIFIKRLISNPINHGMLFLINIEVIIRKASVCTTIATEAMAGGITEYSPV